MNSLIGLSNEMAHKHSDMTSSMLVAHACSRQCIIGNQLADSLCASAVTKPDYYIRTLQLFRDFDFCLQVANRGGLNSLTHLYSTLSSVSCTVTVLSEFAIDNLDFTSSAS